MVDDRTFPEDRGGGAAIERVEETRRVPGECCELK